MVHFPDWRQHQPWDIFTRLDFYIPPILLEEVDDSEFLDVTFLQNNAASLYANRWTW